VKYTGLDAESEIRKKGQPKTAL